VFPERGYDASQIIIDRQTLANPRPKHSKNEINDCLLAAKFVRKIRAVMSGNAREQPALRQLAVRPNWAAVVAIVEGSRGSPGRPFEIAAPTGGRDLALYLGRQHCQLKLHQLGELAGGIEYTTVAMAVRRFEQRLARNKKLAAQTKTAKAQLCKLRCDPPWRC